MSGLTAAERGVAYADRSDLARLTAVGPDFLGLLQRLSTGDVASLAPGEGRPTVLTSPKGRIVERLFVHHFGDLGVLLIGGPNQASRILAHLARYTFAENTGLSDDTASTFAFALLGPDWAHAAEAAGIPALPPYGSISCTVNGVRVRAARTNGYDDQGVLVVGATAERAAVRDALDSAVTSRGGAFLSPDALESWRILRGFPASGHELTEEHNPLEAGLTDAVSFTKGCYVGQEVVARLNTYGKVSRSLVRLRFPAGTPVPAVGASLLVDGEAVGAITSAVAPEDHAGPAALAYVKSREVAKATSVTVVIDGAPHEAALLRD